MRETQVFRSALAHYASLFFSQGACLVWAALFLVILNVLPNPARAAQFEGKEYKWIKERKTQEEAEAHANNLGGHLAVINSKAENDFIFSVIQGASLSGLGTANDGGGVSYVWLGGNDASSENNWVWVNGDTFQYTNWGQAEPDNYFNQDALAMGLQNWPKGSSGSQAYGLAGQWNDISRSNKLTFIVEIKAQSSKDDPAESVSSCTDESAVPSLSSDSTLPIEKRLVVANPGSNKNQQTFVRFVNPSSESVQVELYGMDDSGNASKNPPVSFTLAAGESKQMTAQDLENGNTAKGLKSSMCDGKGKWQITARSSKAIQIMGLIRTPDGFLTGLTDVVPVESGSNIVYFANPASTSQQQTFLRIVNNSATAGTVTIKAIDNLGVTAAKSVSFELAANGSKQMTAQDLENGNTAKGLTGKLGDGTGKWRLTIASSLDLSAQSLIRTPDGFLTNLSALVTPNASGASTLNFFNPASNTAQQSFMRLVNAGTESSAVTISGVDDVGQIAPNGDVTLTLAAGQSIELSAADLEKGNADLQLIGSLGDGSGRWRLDVSSDPQISVMSYVLTSTGFLTNMSEVVGAASTTNTVWIFNPGSNSNQASKLRVINSGSDSAAVNISGIDDAGEASPGANLRFNLSGGSVKEITAAELENGSSEKGLAGGIGDGKGKWRLTVSSDEPVTVQSLLETPAGFITNLSTSAQ